MVFIRSASNGGPSRLQYSRRDIAIGCGRNSGNMNMRNLFKSLKKSKSGASAAEYALIVAVLGGFVVGGATLFGQGLRGAMDTSGDALEGNAPEATGFANPG